MIVHPSIALRIPRKRRLMVPVNVAGTWTKDGVTTPDAVTLLDTNDGSPKVHRVYATVSRVRTGQAFTLVYDLKAGTKTQYNCTAFGGFVQGNIADTSTTAIGGGVVNYQRVALSDGWARFSFSSLQASAAFLIFYIGSGGGTSYKGDGTGSIQVRNVYLIQ